MMMKCCAGMLSDVSTNMKCCAGFPQPACATCKSARWFTTVLGVIADQKGAKAQEIPVLTGLRISQPDGTFACAIDSAPSADLELGGCCTTACRGADDSPPGCKGCGCSTALKV